LVISARSLTPRKYAQSFLGNADTDVALEHGKGRRIYEQLLIVDGNGEDPMVPKEDSRKQCDR
jgi:hypothetical protein